MNNKQILFSIIMEAIDNNDEYIALLYKYNNNHRNTLVIEPKENFICLLSDIKQNFDDNLCGDKKSILSALSFTDPYNETADEAVLYVEIVDGLKENMFNKVIDNE